MRKKVYEFFENVVNCNNLKNGKTLDIGSFNVNGSLRPIFNNYIGLDMREGRNVDIVANSHNIPFPDNTFDCVVSAETLEHDNDPWATIKEIQRVLKYHGWVILSAPGPRFPPHNYPNDYWRFTDTAFRELLKSFYSIYSISDNDSTYGYARKYIGENK